MDKMNEEYSLCTTKIAEYNQQIECLEQELRIQDNFIKVMTQTDTHTYLLVLGSMRNTTLILCTLHGALVYIESDPGSTID